MIRRTYVCVVEICGSKALAQHCVIEMTIRDVWSWDGS